MNTKYTDTVCVCVCLFGANTITTRNVRIYIYVQYINVLITNVNYIYVQRRMSTEAHVSWCEDGTAEWRESIVAFPFFCALFAIFRVIQVFVWKIFNEALCECVCACEHVYKYVIYKLAAIFGGLHWLFPHFHNMHEFY